MLAIVISSTFSSTTVRRQHTRKNNEVCKNNSNLSFNEKNLYQWLLKCVTRTLLKILLKEPVLNSNVVFSGLRYR